MAIKIILVLISLLLGQILSLECDVPGECIGQLIGFTSQDTSPDCLSTCKGTEGCTWYTFRPEEKICNIMQTCTEVDEDNCESCISGEVECPVGLCGEPGLCQGTLIHGEVANSTGDCQDACTNFSGCLYYSYDPTSGECWMFDSCPTLDDTFCPECVSGSPGCDIEYNGHFLMVIGGDFNSYKVELVSLDPTSHPVPDCLTDLNQVNGISEAAGALDYSDGGIPFYCGGYSSSVADYVDTCYKYIPELDYWSVTGTLPRQRSRSGYASSESWGLVMAGGVDGGDNVVSSVPTTKNGMGIISESLPDLPTKKENSCLVVIDDERLFNCGGQGSNLLSETLIFSKSTNSWSRMEDMPRKRKRHSCGLIIDPEIGPEIVAAGGYDSELLDTVDIYTVNTDSWRQANPLPTAMYEAAVVPNYGNSFLLVGGKEDPEYLTSIYQYNASDDEWIELESELRYPRSDHIALLVERSLFPDCAPKAGENK